MERNCIKATQKTKKSYILEFEDGSKRLFHIDNIIKNKKLNRAYRDRWQIMYNEGVFGKTEIHFGILEWPGWVEILNDEYDDFTKEIK